MGEIIKINFINEKSEGKEGPPTEDGVADVIDFKEKQGEKNESIKLKEEIEDIIKKGSKNEDGTYEIRFNLKLETSKRETLKGYLISHGLEFFSIDNEMNANDSDIEFDLDIGEDQISDLLTFFKGEGISYTPIELFIL